MSLAEAVRRPALEQAELVRRGEISSEELVGAHLDLIAALQPQLAAFVQVLDARARRHARASDRRRRARGHAARAFDGVPSAIKDADPLRGAFMRVGSRAYRYAWTPFDGPATRRLRRAGLVFCGKTSTSELTLMPVVEPDIHPPTRNPWNLDHSAGGSSGGAAAAVAAGMLPVAHASDGAGSIRIPAAFCHLFGFKASRALLPNFYARFDPLGLSATGAVTHTVDDSTAVLDALRGDVAHPATPGSLLAEVRRAPPAGLRVKLCLESPLAEVDPEIAAAVTGVAKLLEGLGHRVDTTAALAAEVEEFMPIFQRLAAGAPVLREASLQPITRWLRVPGRRVSPAQAREVQERLSRRVLDWFGDADLALLPAVAVLAPRVYAWRDLPPEEGFARAAKLGAFTAAFNVSGQPAASLPVGVSAASGLPYAAQLVARPGADLLLLQTCRQLESALAWTRRRAPPLAAARTPGDGAGDAAHH
jgi:amidase